MKSKNLTGAFAEGNLITSWFTGGLPSNKKIEVEFRVIYWRDDKFTRKTLVKVEVDLSALNLPEDIIHECDNPILPCVIEGKMFDALAIGGKIQCWYGLTDNGKILKRIFLTEYVKTAELEAQNGKQD